MHSYSSYSGPWVENVWINQFETQYDESDGTCARDIFGPFIPIFVPWTVRWSNYELVQSIWLYLIVLSLNVAAPLTFVFRTFGSFRQIKGDIHLG